MDISLAVDTFTLDQNKASFDSLMSYHSFQQLNLDFICKLKRWIGNYERTDENISTQDSNGHKINLIPSLNSLLVPKSPYSVQAIGYNTINTSNLIDYITPRFEGKC